MNRATLSPTSAATSPRQPSSPTGDAQRAALSPGQAMAMHFAYFGDARGYVTPPSTFSRMRQLGFGRRQSFKASYLLMPVIAGKIAGSRFPRWGFDYRAGANLVPPNPGNSGMYGPSGRGLAALANYRTGPNNSMTENNMHTMLADRARGLSGSARATARTGQAAEFPPLMEKFGEDIPNATNTGETVRVLTAETLTRLYDGSLFFQKVGALDQYDAFLAKLLNPEDA